MVSPRFLHCTKTDNTIAFEDMSVGLHPIQSDTEVTQRWILSSPFLSTPHLLGVYHPWTLNMNTSVLDPMFLHFVSLRNSCIWPEGAAHSCLLLQPLMGSSGCVVGLYSGDNTLLIGNRKSDGWVYNVFILSYYLCGRWYPWNMTFSRFSCSFSCWHCKVLSVCFCLRSNFTEHSTLETCLKFCLPIPQTQHNCY